MKRALLSLLASAALALTLVPPSSFASSEHEDAEPKLNQNQTFGFGGDRLLRFTYEQNFACVHEPQDDRNYNGIKAESDPAEFQTPICQVGTQPTIDPTGIPVARSEPLYVLVPMFSLNHDQNPNDAFSPELGKTLIALFGAVPEALKKKPLVDVQCPDRKGHPGTCTMHASRVDLYPALAALGKVPAEPEHNIFVPTPNHSHLVNNDAVSTNPIWWQVITVLVTSPQDWPNDDGTSGITSAAKLKQAESAGSAIEAPSNFFLFFDSKVIAHQHH